MDRTPRGHGRTKYVQSKYAESSVYEEVDETLPSWNDYEDTRPSKGAIYRVRKERYKRFSPYERRSRDSDRSWTHDKFDEDEDNERIEARRGGGRRRRERERRGDRWVHDKYDESEENDQSDEMHRHDHSSSNSSRRRRRRSSSRSRSMERMKSDDDDDDEMGSEEGEKTGEIRGYKVSVKGLSAAISTVSGLTKVFSKWGKITDCGIDKDEKSGYVVYEDKEAAKDAVTFVNKTEYHGKKLVVSHDGLLII